MINGDLQKQYDTIYGSGKQYFTLKSDLEEASLILNWLPRWSNLRVLDIGCGKGQLTHALARCGAKAMGIDYSIEAIKIAKKARKSDATFFCADYRNILDPFPNYKCDVLILKGVLEHLDHPFEELDWMINSLLTTDRGIALITCPGFLNPRGYVWMTLHCLFDMPMSQTDMHFLNPFDFEEFCEKNDYDLDIRSCEQDWGAGDKTIKDFEGRLCDQLGNHNHCNTNVDSLLAWMEKAMPYFEKTQKTGAVVGYKIVK